MSTIRTTPLMLGALLLFGGIGCDGQETDSAHDAPAQMGDHGEGMASKGAHGEGMASKGAHGEGMAGHGDANAPMAESGDMSVYFVYPQAGSTIPETFDVAFGVRGYTLTPAGQHMEDKARGHHHIIVDGGPVPEGEVVPKDETHIHYGGGENHATLTLSPGEHTLTMQLADGAHRSFGPKAAKTIQVTVKEGIGEAKVAFQSPKDGETVKSPVKVVFGLEGMKVRPAGEDTLDKTTGHHHLIIDGEAAGVGEAVPADETHIHYGKGQTEAEIPLTPGKHTLTMQLADGAHLSYGPRLSQTITVNVVE